MLGRKNSRHHARHHDPDPGRHAHSGSGSGRTAGRSQPFGHLEFQEFIQIPDRLHSGALINHLGNIIGRSDRRDIKINQLQTILIEFGRDDFLEIIGQLGINRRQIKNRIQLFTQHIVHPRDNYITQIILDILAGVPRLPPDN